MLLKNWRVVALCYALWMLPGASTLAQEADPRGDYIRANYAKFEYRIPMRDGTQLFTSAYIPYDASADKRYPIIMSRTPYSVGPYGANVYKTRLGPSPAFEESGYIFVFQDVRGCYMSDGEFINMRPHLENKQGEQYDESSDTYDTIEWLVNQLDCDNGRVGQWGISYPGFYTSAGAIDSHPALKCISPQAPIADWYWDDMHRNGAFNVQLSFTFFSSFGRVRSQPTVNRNPGIDLGTNDSYQFFLDLGPLRNVNELHFKGEIPFWNEITQHPNYDEFWKSRNILPHLKNVRCASLVVGGWYDTEDLFGPLKTYEAIEANNPGTESSLVMGPWYHGGWNREDGSSLGDARFDWATAKWYRDEVEFPFFEWHLKQVDRPAVAEATMFETGANRWRKFDSWPPAASRAQTLFFAADGGLSWEAPSESGDSAVDRFISDPSKPVPYTTEITGRWSKDYMTEDQRFAARRPDVLVYRSPVLESDVTLSGPMLADLWFSTTESDADIVVKVIDEFPGRPVDGSSVAPPDFQSGRQQLVRAQVMRGRFRNSFELPEAFVPGEPAEVHFELHDVLHTFKRGHRIMLQVQSTWFPFVDRNPQKFVPNIFEATQADFVPATHSLFRGSDRPSQLKVRVLAP